MSDILQVFKQLNQKISLLQKKIDAVLLRLEICQKNAEKSNITKQLSRFQNPLQSYIANDSEVQSFRQSPTNRMKEQDIMLLQSQNHFDQKFPIKFLKNEVRESILDSKSFATIKRSILINSQEIDHMKQRILSFERQYIKRIIGLEEGIQILTRLSCLIDQKVTDNSPQSPVTKEEPESPKKNKAYQTHKLVQKYMREEQINKSLNSSHRMHKYL